MKTVYTKTALIKAFEEKEQVICAKGHVARIIKSKIKRRKYQAILSGVILCGISLAAIPFTGGFSSAGVATGVSVFGLTMGSVTITTAELAIICGTILGLGSIIAGAKVTFSSDHVIIEPKYKG